MTYSAFSIFAAGLLTFASPCVLPLIPVYLAALAGGSVGGVKRGRLLLLASSFALGLSVVFIALGALASTVGAVIAEHRTSLEIASGVLMLLFGLRALGVLRVHALGVEARPGLDKVRDASTLAGSFLFGAAFALGWSPCIGPVLASVLSFAASSTGSAWEGGGYLGIYAAGISVPLVAAAAAASHVQAWGSRLRGVAPRLEKVTGLALVAFGLWTAGSALTASSPDRDDLASTPSSSDPSAAPHPGAVPAPSVDEETCEAEGEGALCELPAAADAQSIEPNVLNADVQMLEFTAQTCPVCERMKPVIERAVAMCGGLGKKLVEVDVATSKGRALAARHFVRGTPTFVLLDEAGIERGRILGEQSADIVSDALTKAFGATCQQGSGSDSG